MSCCGARNPSLAVRSQDFDRCHSLLLASSAAGGARKRPRFGNPPYAGALYTMTRANASRRRSFFRFCAAPSPGSRRPVLSMAHAGSLQPGSPRHRSEESSGSSALEENIAWSAAPLRRFATPLPGAGGGKRLIGSLFPNTRFLREPFRALPRALTAGAGWIIVRLGNGTYSRETKEAPRWTNTSCRDIWRPSRGPS